MPSLPAQWNLKENNIWCFGNLAGLNFTTGNPASFRSGMANGSLTGEANASVADANGVFLFCTNGETVWDRNNAAMPDGNPLHPYANGSLITRSTTQGALVVPFPDSADKYYVFSLTQKELGNNPPGAGKLYYSVVDMSLNGGLGGVDPGRKWILLDTNLTEKMTAVAGDDCNVWLLVHSRDSNLFKAYEITRSGIGSAPVLSAVGTFGNSEFWDRGELKVAPGRNRIIACATLGRAAELYDFDPATGQVSNPLLLDGTKEYYGTAFSPDGSKLYVNYVTGSGAQIQQFNLNAPTPAAVVNSGINIGGCNFSQLRLAPDGRIYFQTANATGYLGAIRNPDAAGPACQFTSLAVSLVQFTGMRAGLPAEVVKAPPPDTIAGLRMDTVLCDGQTLTLAASPGYTAYYWQDGQTGATRTINQAGVYRVTYQTGYCHVGVDSFVISSPDTLTGHVVDTAFCAGEYRMSLSATPGFTDYLWDDLLTASERTITAPGVYNVIYRTGMCRYMSDRFVVRPPDTVTARTDHVLCFGDPAMELNAPPGRTAYLWDNGEAGPVRTVAHPETYYLTSRYDCRWYIDTFAVTLTKVDFDLGNDTVVCRDMPLLLYIPVPGAAYQWQDQSTDSTFLAASPGTYRAQATLNGCIASDTIIITPGYCDCIMEVPSAYTPNGDGRNDIFRPVFSPGCETGSYKMAIYSRWGQLVFSTLTPTEGWDGTWQGSPVEIGTYMYLIHLNGTDRKGDLTLIR